MKKLNPAQIAKLAEYVEVSIRLNPISMPSEHIKDVCFGMEDWEKHLMSLINSDDSLPKYEEFCATHVHILEFLIGYYIS